MSTAVAKAVASSPKKVSRLKAVKPKAAEPSKPEILVFGKLGVGKIWVILDFPKVYYIDRGGADFAHYTKKLERAGGARISGRPRQPRLQQGDQPAASSGDRDPSV